MTKNKGLVSIHDLAYFESTDGYIYLNDIDEVENSVRVVSHAEGSLHDGHKFIVDFLASGLADAANKDFWFTTPAAATAYIHTLQFDGWINNAQGRILIYESATCSAGTAQTITNANRNSTESSSITISESGSVSIATARQLPKYVFGGGGANTASRTGGGTTFEYEYVLKPSTTYVIRMSNKSGDSATISLVFQWTEESAGINS